MPAGAPRRVPVRRGGSCCSCSAASPWPRWAPAWAGSWSAVWRYPATRHRSADPAAPVIARALGDPGRGGVPGARHPAVSPRTRSSTDRCRAVGPRPACRTGRCRIHGMVDNPFTLTFDDPFSGRCGAHHHHDVSNPVGGANADLDGELRRGRGQ
ncbi:hypothetical protein HBB16_10115 [Pseudonocardia sp. MCCB 268]|nr:hypothetical protein [Pseudonocardia cytotoxica]